MFLMQPILVQGEARKDPALSAAVLEIRMKHPLLRDDVQVVCTPCNDTISFEQSFHKAIEGCTPLLLYTFADDALSDKVGYSGLLLLGIYAGESISPPRSRTKAWWVRGMKRNV